MGAKNKMMILSYHGIIGDFGANYAVRHLNVKPFEKQLKYLKQNFDIITCKEVARLYREGIQPKKPAVALTFDDGFENNLIYAVPLLKQFEIPASFFICTKGIEDRGFIIWADYAEFLQNRVRPTSMTIRNVNFEMRNGVLYSKEKNQYMLDYIKSLPAPEHDKFMEEMVERFDLDSHIKRLNPDYWKLLDHEQVRMLAQSKWIDIGSHSHSHYNLSSIDATDVKRELQRSKQILEEAAQQETSMLAYPDGSYNAKVKELSKEAGYRELFAVTYKVEDDMEDTSILPRIGLSNSTTWQSNMIRIHSKFDQDGIEILI